MVCSKTMSSVRRLFVLLTALILALAPARGLSGQASPASQTVQLPAPGEAVPPTLAIQILLDRAGFSPGQIDGAAGANTRRAMEAFRRARNVPAGEAALQTALNGDGAELLTSYTITDQDAAGPFVPEIPKDLMAQAQWPSLSYTSVLELVAERAHSSPALLRKLNPGAAFVAGETVRIPNVVRAAAPAPVAPEKPQPGGATKPASSAEAKAQPAVDATRVVVSRGESGLTVYDNQDRVIFFAPVTSGSQHDPLPLGKWTVTAVVRNPTFHYNPDLFWDADPTHARVKLRPGPNGPVGTVWIDLSKPHYGIHGTPEPGNVGHTASHGCVRMTNWDVETLAGLVQKGTVVIFER
jgi:lipoprotein-anchoring transpeptidase ErfK/SrfK